MAFKLPLSVQVLGAKASTVLSAVLPGYRGGVIAEQSLFFKDAFRVAKYGTVEEITTATAKLKWTSDPWDGKLDVVKHPTFMQQAIEQHPDYAGDCDDFAAYWCVALHKNKLADEQWFSYAYWLDRNGVTGHAVCVFRVKDHWFYAGNWNACVPIPLASRDAWVADIESRVKTKVITAAMFAATGGRDDTMLLGRSIVARF